MAISQADIGLSRASRVKNGWPCDSSGVWWLQRREKALNWLALGLLLAAWNASDHDSETQPPRPAALRGYSSVSVRATTLCSQMRPSSLE